MTKVLSLFSIFIPLVNESNTNVLDNAQCQACQWVVSAIEAYLAQDTTEIELSRVFATLCTVLPGISDQIDTDFFVLII